MKVAITGANGYLGSKLVDLFTQNGAEVIKLVRHVTDDKSIQFSLTGGLLNPEKFSNADWLIHAAHDFTSKNWAKNYAVNVQGAINLFNLAKQYHVKGIIFISSMSAYSGCKSKYGRSKLLVEEQIINNYNGYIIRPGLIYGLNSGGMINSLQKLVKLPLLPLIGSKSKLYLCHISDLANYILSIANVQQVSLINKPVIAANSNAYTFKVLLKLLGAKFLIPLPWQPLWLFIKCFELLGFNPKTGSDSLYSLLNQNNNPDFINTRQTKINFREFNSKQIN